jgi:hypothetical protein
MSGMLFFVNVSAIDSSSDFSEAAVSRGIATVPLDPFDVAARVSRSNCPNVIGTVLDGCIHCPSF